MIFSSWQGQPIAIAPGLAISLGILAVIIFIIVIILKGYSLWYAARRGEKVWFVILLIVNTIGILELIYLLAVVKKWPGKSPSSTPSSNP